MHTHRSAPTIAPISRPALPPKPRMASPSPHNQDRPSAAAGAGATSAPSPDDLLIVGPGVLGAYLGLLWKQAHPGATVVAQTNTPTRHAALAALGLSPRTGDRPRATPEERYALVAFAAPPSGSPDYVGAIQSALALWDDSAPGACFVFTGSAGVVGVDDGGPADEASPTVARGAAPRTDTLLAAEDAVLGAGGCVLRLAGLYHASRGAHSFFLKAPGGAVPGRSGGYTVNLLHYEDAARLAAAVLGGDGGPPGGAWRGRVFLGCDGSPLTFDEMVAAAAACPAACPGGVPPPGPITFGGPTDGPSRGKRMTNRATRAALGGWAPKYASFQAFTASPNGGRDAYNTDARLGGLEAGAAHA